ncbi:MAG: RND family efflux transporter MFP subunit [Ignavibacteria bacterium]|nr:MAG: RND family efflux transporter MFP subunit [Ignavibacteria bacterium]KAF0161564.1 MAG: RND family efflux transporter MFP subunit [Ignavibacteria bacterium]
MKNWKAIVGVVVVTGIIVTILAINKKKLDANTSGGIDITYYVSVANAAKKNLTSQLSLTGKVYANNDVNVLSETTGKIVAVFAKVGDYKQAGSVLAQVDDELRRAAFISAEANWLKAKNDLARFEKLYQEKSVSDTQYEQMKVGAAMAETNYIVAKRQLEDTKIKTPIAGYVTNRPVDVGTMLQGAPQPSFVANIVDLSRVKIKLNLSETDAVVLKTGDHVNVVADVYPGTEFDGKIESISSKADEANTYAAEISIANLGKHQLKAGMFVRAEFTSMRERDVIVVPRSALVGSIKNPQVFVVENGLAKLRNLTIGKESGPDVHVVAGLNEGEILVVNGQNNLVDNTKVAILNK